jgi:hypothetical protein
MRDSLRDAGVDDDPWGLNVIRDFSEPEESSEGSWESDDDVDNIAELRRLDAESENGSWETNSQISDDDSVIIRTGDEDPPITTAELNEFKRPFHYEPETLMRLIPDGPDFDRVRETLRIQKTVYKYSPDVSNNVFEREYAKRVGRHAPKTLKVFKVVYKGDELSMFYGNKHPFSSANVFRPVRKSPSKRAEPKVRRKNPCTGGPLPESGVRVTLSPAKGKPLPQISRIEIYRNECYVNEIGGISYKLPKTIGNKISAMKWYRNRRGEPFFSNTFGVIRKLAEQSKTGQG